LNRSVQLVARNHECPKGVNSVLCVVWSCNKLHAMHEIKTFRAWFFRATSCTLHGITLGMCRSCNKMHATHEIVNVRKG